MIALCCTGEVPGKASCNLRASFDAHFLLTGLAAVFCANFSRLLILSPLVNLNAPAFLRRMNWSTTTAQNVKTTGRIKIESRSSKLLVPFSFRLGMWCSGLGLGQSAPSIERSELLHRGQTLGLRSGLPSTPLITYPVGSGAKLTSCYSPRVPYIHKACNSGRLISTSFRHMAEE